MSSLPSCTKFSVLLVTQSARVLRLSGFDLITDYHIFSFTNFVEKLASCMLS